MRKSLIAEMSKLTCFGPIRLLRPQLPNSGTTVLVKAAGLNHPWEVGWENTGSTPATQLRRLLTENPVPGETHQTGFSALPLFAVALTPSCHPPTKCVLKPPRVYRERAFPHADADIA